jgi:hypothetical protein
MSNIGIACHGVRIPKNDSEKSLWILSDSTQPWANDSGIHMVFQAVIGRRKVAFGAGHVVGRHRRNVVFFEMPSEIGYRIALTHPVWAVETAGN